MNSLIKLIEIKIIELLIENRWVSRIQILTRVPYCQYLAKDKPCGMYYNREIPTISESTITLTQVDDSQSAFR